MIASKRFRRISPITLAAATMLWAASSFAAIISPTGATASSEFGPDYDIGNTFDQSGLSLGFTSGVTDFDGYLALNPTHSYVAVGNEWFTSGDVVGATVTYDLGGAKAIDRLALWHEEFSGFGAADIFASLDNIAFAPLATILPVDNTGDADYAAQVFAFAAVSARYLRFELSGCPQAPSLFDGCGIGEVAFATVGEVSQVPLPGALWLFLSALAGLGMVKRRFASA